MSARRRARAQNKLFYTWLRVVELRNIQAAKWIVARRRRQKLKLALLLQSTGPGGAQQHSSHTEGHGVAG